MKDAHFPAPEITDILTPFRKRNIQQGNIIDITAEYSANITRLIKDFSENESLKISILAAGSLVRNEQFPFTAIDILFAAESNDLFALEAGKIIRLERMLLSVGVYFKKIFITPFHNSMRDLALLTRILESNLVYGDKSILLRLRGKCLFDVKQQGAYEIFDALCDRHTVRFRKYGSSPKMLEPNIKLSPGGLQDLHNLYWLAQLYTISEQPSDSRKYIEFIQEFLNSNGIVPDSETRFLPAARAELLYARYSLFRKYQKKKDRFESVDQQAIATRLKKKSPDALREYMREFYAATTLINSTMYAIKQWRVEKLASSLPDTLKIVLDDDFYLKGGLLFSESKDEFSFTDSMKACYFQVQYQVALSQSCRNKILDVSRRDNQGFTGEAISYFNKIFASPKSIVQAIRSMNELKLIQIIAPQFEDLQGFTERGSMHFYTAEEHILKSITRFEELEDQKDVFGKVFQMTANKMFCRFALLFHDIAKPADMDGHPLVSAEIASGLLNRLGYEESVISRVCFLVKNHLLMRQHSFEKGVPVDDIHHFVEAMPSAELLNYLLLVTYSDLAAVSPTYWTSWKQELLISLFLKASKQIEIREEVREEVRFTDDMTRPASEMYNALQSEHLAHLHSMTDEDYFSRYTESEIGELIQEIARGKQLSIIWHDETKEPKVTIITRDAAYLLAKCCGVFSINELNIHSAMVFTRQDGVAIFTFTVSDMKKRDLSDSDFQDDFFVSMNRALTGILQVGVELTKIRQQWRAFEKKLFKKRGQIRISFEDDVKFTVIDIFAPDRVGLLYHVSKKLSDLGLSIYFAKINTSNNEISDVFYTLDRFKKKVSLNYYKLIETELTTLIEDLV